jgi:hypothetical protein
VKALTSFIERHKAGSPTDASVYWIHLKPCEIAVAFAAQSGQKVSHGCVKRVLQNLGYKYRKLRKDLATGTYARRNEQFEIIFRLVALMSLKTPILSMDCKKKERLGHLYREGKILSSASIKVFDHDYDHLSEGKVIPHGIYDLQRNEVYVTIGTSHETAQFIKDNLLWWWDNFGIHQYPDTHQILILCDAGGANSYRHHAFKKQMQLLAKSIGKDIIICHYPPYNSKWNPIEHRVFPHMHKAMQGVIFSDYTIVKQLIAKTTTKNKLLTVVRISDIQYDVGIKTTKNDLDYSTIFYNQAIPELSYRIAA